MRRQPLRVGALYVNGNGFTLKWPPSNFIHAINPYIEGPVAATGRGASFLLLHTHTVFAPFITASR